MKSFLALSFVYSLIVLSFSANASLLEVEKKRISIYEDNAPSVVNVSNIKIRDSYLYGSVEVPQGAGSGYIWDTSGHVVTNFHVVQGGNSFIVNFKNDKSSYKATVVGVEPKKDIAVLKLNKMPKGIRPLKRGNSSSLKVGQLTIAIGNPFGLDHSMSSGIISALGRKINGIGGVKIHDMIQTDAAINQGNSGGPLLNSSGELIGMNTMIFSTSGSNTGLGFAVPVDTINRIVPQLIKHGKVIRPALGIGVLDDDVRERYIGKKGAIISYVDEAGAAYNAGLKGLERDRYGRMYLGDVILKIENIEVNSRNDIYHVLEKFKIGDKVNIQYKRNGKLTSTKIKLKSM